MKFPHRRSLWVAAALALASTPWETAFAQGTRHKRQTVDATFQLMQPWTPFDVEAAIAELEFNQIRQALPGNEATWFVLVLQNKYSAKSKGRSFRIVQGRTAATQVIVRFGSDGRVAQKKFEYRAFSDLAQALDCYQMVKQYSWLAGYR